MDAYSVREKQGLVPDLQLDDSHYELKGIRVDSSHNLRTRGPQPRSPRRLKSGDKPPAHRDLGASKKLLSVAVTTGATGDLGAVVCKWALQV
jgi:hypothetical protein